MTTTSFNNPSLLVLFCCSFFVLHVSACTDITNVIASTVHNGDICSSAAFTSGASSTINGKIVAAAAITLGASTKVTGSLQAGAAITLGANANVGLSIHAGADITLGAYSRVSGTAISDTGVITYGLGATVGYAASLAAATCADITNIVANTIYTGDICSSTSLTTGADSTVNGYITAVKAITVGANGIVTGQLEAGTAITIGSNAVVNNRIHAGGVITLGAYSHVSGTAVSDIGVINYGLGSSVGQAAAIVQSSPTIGVCTITIVGFGQIICNNYCTAATVVTLTGMVLSL